MRGRIYGILLALLLTTAMAASAQLERNVVPAGGLLPCCVVESMDASGGFLILKNAGSGELLRVMTPTVKYRLGQAVDQNTLGTTMVLTPFPVEYQKTDTMHHNAAWKMRSRVVLTAEGRFDGETLIQSSEVQRGFTGGVEVLLLDRVGNILHQTNLRKYGVEANSSRTSNWQETASVATVNKVRAVVVHHSYEPTVRLAASLAWINANASQVSERLTCIRQKAGTAIQCSGSGRETR